MKRKILVFAVIFCIAAVFSAQALIQFRLDPLVNVPFMLGAKDGFSGTGYEFFLNNIIPFPELDAHLQFDLDMVKIGIGVRAFTFIAISAMTPDVFVEVHLDPVVLRASVAGGAVFIFGILPSQILTGPIILPDINVTLKLADFFRIGAGCIFIADFNNLSSFLYAPYIQARFVFTFGEKNESDE
jgi:hypothetical protein